MLTEEQIFQSIFRDLVTYGSKSKPRGLEIIELENYSYELGPYQRFCNFEARKLNLGYIKEEFKWYLRGNLHDLSITEHAKMWKDLVNPNGTINSNYGHYIFGISMFLNVANELINDKDSRRASLVILNNGHLTSDTKDVPCLAGETVMNSPEGNITIKDLSDKFKKEKIKSYPLFTFNEKTRNIEIKKCINVWKSGYKKLLKITFDDGTYLKCTPDHLIYQKKIVKRKTFIDIKEAKEFKVKERIWATKFFNNAKGRPTFIKNLSDNWHYKNQVCIHREYDEFLNGKLPEGMCVHHIDDDKNNNKKDNLQRLSKSIHDSLKMFGDDNPMRRETKENNIKRRLKLKKTLKKIGKSNHGWGLYHKNKKLSLNHKIINIEEIESEDVYDFTCEENHNAVVGTGIIVHNCTYAINFRIRQNKLKMSVCMRSQDAVFGMSNDLPCFSFIHEMMFEYLKDTYKDLEYGNYFHFANSFHVYERHYKMVNDILNQPNTFTKIDCPKISGKEEVEFLIKSNFEEIPNNFEFAKWLNK